MPDHAQSDLHVLSPSSKLDFRGTNICMHGLFPELLNGHPLKAGTVCFEILLINDSFSPKSHVRKVHKKTLREQSPQRHTPPSSHWVSLSASENVHCPLFSSLWLVRRQKKASINYPIITWFHQPLHLSFACLEGRR